MKKTDSKPIGVFRELKLYLRYCPRYVRAFLGRQYRYHKASKYRKQILEDKERILEVLADAETPLKYIENSKKITTYNADFENKCNPFNTPVYFDEDLNLRYVFADGKKLYYPVDYSKRHIQYWFNSVSWEQDINSPHLYLDSSEELNDTILFDCGSAEGNLPVMNIERLKHAYLFEGDNAWIKPLEATFAPWKDKITIVNRFLGSEKGMLSLGQYIENLLNEGTLSGEEKIFIKMDVEGYEPDLMRDISPVLEKLKNVQLAVCVYHKHDEEAEVINCIHDGFGYRTRPGYMVFYSYEDEIKFPYFRHGVIRIERS